MTEQRLPMFASTAALVLAICVGSVCGLRIISAAECEVPVHTEAGTACGRLLTAERDHHYVSFLGLPYGKPPLAERRFSVLEPMDPWDGLLDATEECPACPQKEIIYGRMTRQPRGQSEDCICLNVHVPYQHFPADGAVCNETSGLPMVVMVHGGGFQSGSGLTDVHGPAYLMATESVLVVTLNYRINVFGFLSLGTAKIPGNQGLHDVLHALRWVRRNARAFGGDPDNVTLMGQSAGASMVHLLSLSEAAEGLFHRIILMSGHAIPMYFATNPQFAEKIATKFIQLLGINSTDPDYIHRTLTELPLEDIMYANSLIQYMGLTSFVPVVEQERDGRETVVNDNPVNLMAKGRGTQYPILFGFTNNEAEFFKWVAYVWQFPQRIKNNPGIIVPQRIAYHYSNKTEAIANRTVEKCFNGDFSLDNFVKCYSYQYFIYPILKIAEWRSMGGAPAYLYKYSYESKRSMIKEALWTTYRGATHVEDLTYIFRTNSLMGDYVSFPPQNEDDLMKLWWVTTVTNFTKCNNPTCTEDEAQWPPLSGETLQYHHITSPAECCMEEFNEDEVDWVQYYGEMDEEVRNVAHELEKVFEAEKSFEKRKSYI